MEKCTRCHCDLDDFKVDISFSIRVDRKKDSSLWEYIPNLDNNSREVLCLECFDKFSALMGQLNIDHKNA